MKTLSEIDTFTSSYIACALWSSMDSYDDGGEPLDSNYGPEDIAPETLQRMQEDCEAFQNDNREDLDSSGLDASQQGHDFWLTRNHHGAGYWDRGIWGPLAARLTEAAHAWGSFDLYVGDDGKIHGS